MKRRENKRNDETKYTTDTLCMEIKVERKRAKSSNRIDRILHYGKLYFFVKKNNQFFLLLFPFLIIH